MTLPAGAMIANRYEVLGYLGGGTYGEVYRVKDHYQNDEVALKLLRPLGGGQIWQEAQLLTLLRSPYILEVRNADIDSGVPYLVTELAPNGALDGLLTPAGVSPTQAVRWIRHAARGTHRTHGDRLLHRDIKPGNIFLDQSNEALLGDFGIAVAMDANGQGPSLGTPATRAPEVSAGKNTSVASDVYSLGATLYTLLAGNYPAAFGTAPLRDVAPHVSIALAQRVHKAMETDPADRYASAADFDAALGALPVPRRQWRRTNEHGAHAACWRGQASGMSDATVCLVAAGTRFEVIGSYQPSGRRITAACRSPAPRSAVSRNVRAAIAAIP